MTLALTILAAVLVMILVMLLLLIGKIITGKSRLTRGTCGRIPKEKGKTADKNCSICGSTEKCEKEDKEKL